MLRKILGGSCMVFLRRSLPILLLALAACATASPKVVPHQFSFDGWFDGWAKKVNLLEYSYGDQYRMVAKKVAPGQSTLGYQANVNGPMPVGEFLYVKWQLQEGQVCEQRVDLRPLLPRDMSGHALTFVIDGPQLHVYVVTPVAKKPADPPILKTYRSETRVTYEIYPNNTNASR